MTILGLILARGGSKRVPGKNLRKLGDIPLLGWAISSAFGAGCFDRLVVSSDSARIRREARNQWGVEALNRPAEMATDTASPYPAMLHAIDAMGEPFDYMTLLQPTSPFRLPEDIIACIDKAITEEAPCVASAEKDCDVPNGAVYVARVDWLRDALAVGNPGPFDGPAVKLYMMPPERSLDIDTEDDFEHAQAMVATWAA